VSTDGRTSERPRAAGMSREQVVTVGSHQVRVSVERPEAAGVPLLLCNGVGAEHALWGAFRENLAPTTVALDVRAEHLGKRPSMRRYASFLRAVLDELGFDAVDVLGLSWGGIAAQQLAHDHHERVRRLVLASTTPGFLSLPAKPSSTLRLMSPRRDASKIHEVIAKVYGGDFIESPQLASELGLIRRLDEKAYRRQLVAVVGWTSVPWLSTIQNRTLILHGDNDPVIPYVNAHIMRRMMPHASLRTVSQGGHLFLYTRPDEYARVVNEFLNGEQRSGGGRLGPGLAGPDAPVSGKGP
jgi:pimeloyl-ACP methyl ester carboxylesterase